ncbi:MAG TPA: pyridoxal-phosphate dependent enzyme [Vicinamibacterales bacterium]|nr:pyridoxal-phosphate dependent enzyme [Vicinamibacterales bacterium]
MNLDLSVARIEEAARTIDPVFLNSPQYADAQLSAALGRNVMVKVETANPLRSFKGRGAEYLMARLDAGADGRIVVCSSTGNFGQAVAYAGRRRKIRIDVFVPENVNPVKLARMRSFGAKVTATGADSAAAEAAARDRVASASDCIFIEDGKEPAIAEGAGTIGLELLKAGPLDTVVLPVGDGALITGVACWIKHHAPDTRIVGVCASGAPCMALSWRAGKPVSTERSDTIAEGIEVSVPVPESVARLVALVDDMVLVDDGDLLQAMQLSAETLGLLLEPSGAAGLAAIKVHELPGERLATVLTGSNVRPEHFRMQRSG